MDTDERRRDVERAAFFDEGGEAVEGFDLGGEDVEKGRRKNVHSWSSR
jgi:hypothetical protein